MPRILAIDSTEQTCSVALTSSDHQVRSLLENQPRKHSELLLPMVDQLLAESQINGQALDAIAVSIGPGAFTGLRIGCSIAQGLAFGWGLPMIPVISLEAFAYSYFRVSERLEFASGSGSESECYILGVLDARLDELYTGLYQCTVSESNLLNVSTFIEPCLVAPTQLNEMLIQNDSSWIKNKPLIAMGSGLIHASTIFSSLKTKPISKYTEHQITAVDIANLALDQFKRGETIDCLALEPKYLRKAV